MMLQVLRVWIWPILWGILLYAAIDANTPEIVDYNSVVANFAMLGAATLLLIAVLTGCGFQKIQPVVASWVVALILSIAASTWWAVHVPWALVRDVLYYAVILLGLGLYLSARDTDGQVILRYFIVISVVHLIFLVDTVFYLAWINSEPGVVFSRLPNFGNIRHFAYIGFIGAACATSLFVMNKKLEVTAFILATAALFGIFLLGARGALLAWITSTISLLIFCQSRWRLLLFCILTPCVAEVAVYWCTEMGWVPEAFLMTRRFGSGEAFGSSGRIDLWLQTMRAIADHPWLGFGPEGFLASSCCTFQVDQPHNFILQFLLELGFIGFFALFGTVWAIIRAFGGWVFIWKNLRTDSALLSVCSVLIGFLAYASIDGLLYHGIPLIHFALLLALLCASMVRLGRADGT